MLEGLRAVKNTWIGKAILTGVMGFIVVSFVVWGVGDIFRGAGGNTVARVGSVEISAQAYQKAYQGELQGLRQRFRRTITNEEAHQFGIDGQVLSRMISDAVLDDRVQSLGLAISDAEIAKAITSDPALAGPNGSFDRTRFNDMLREQGESEIGFVREQRRVYLRQQFVVALAGALAVPQAALAALGRYQDETRRIDTLTLDAAAIGPTPRPDDASLQTYFAAHQRDFDAPQYRKLVVLSLTPAGLAKPETVAEADVRRLYDEVKGTRYGTAEHRTLQQMAFPTDAEAAAAYARIKAGTSFADVAKDRKLEAKDIDLGRLTQAQIFDKAVGAAAFSLPPDGTSEPVKGTFGPVLIHVVSVEPGSVQPFDVVQATLKSELAVRAAATTIRTLHDAIEDARSSGKSLTDAAKAAGLKTRTIEAIDDKGFDKGGKPVEGLADRDALIRAAFASDIGVDNDTVQSRDGGMTWFEVAGVEPARPKPLAEVRDQVEAAWLDQETAKRLDEKAASLVASLSGGQSLQQVAASLGGVPVSQTDGVKRGGAEGLTSEAVAKVFDVPVGGAGTAHNGPGRRLVFKVRSSVVPALDASAPRTVQLADRYRNALSEDILGAYLSRVGAQIGVKVHQEVLRSASGASF